MAISDIIVKGFNKVVPYIVTKGFGNFVESTEASDSGWIATRRTRTWIAKPRNSETRK